jgi:hypothetical protein
MVGTGRFELPNGAALQRTPRMTTSDAALRTAQVGVLAAGSSSADALRFDLKKESKWSGRADSNCRPLAPQASALPG